jgi:hypothetical protein
MEVNRGNVQRIDIDDTIPRGKCKPFYQRIDNELHINMHPGQIAVYDIHDTDERCRVLLAAAGWQGGKTLIGPPWLQRRIEQRLQQGYVGTISDPLDFIAASGNYDLMRLKMLPALQGLFCSWTGWGRYSASDRIIYGPEDKIRIIMRSADATVGLESFTALDGWADEWGLDEVPLRAYESMMRGLSIAEGHLLLTTTLWNLGWLKIMVYDKAIGGDPMYRVVSFPSLANPAFPLSEWQRVKESFPDWKFQMRYNGSYSRPAGLIYTDYEDSYASFGADGSFIGGGNLVKSFTIPGTWMRDLGIDFGESANCGRLWVAEDAVTHYLYIYRDALGGGLNGPEYAREALEYAEPIRQAMGGARSEQERRDQWARAGLPVVEPQIQDVEGGIDHFNALFKQRRIFVLDTCTRLRSELGTYSRELDAAGEPTAKIADKVKFHLLDGGRYIASRYSLVAAGFSKPVVEVDITGRTVEAARLRAKMFQVQESEEYR